MTPEVARMRIKEQLEKSGVDFGSSRNQVEYVVDGYLKSLCGWHNGSGMQHMLKVCREEVKVLYDERMEVTARCAEELERLAEIGRAVEWAYEEGFMVTFSDECEYIEYRHGDANELVKAYRESEESK